MVKQKTFTDKIFGLCGKVFIGSLLFGGGFFMDGILQEPKMAKDFIYKEYCMKRNKAWVNRNDTRSLGYTTSLKLSDPNCLDLFEKRYGQYINRKELQNGLEEELNTFYKNNRDHILSVTKRRDRDIGLAIGAIMVATISGVGGIELIDYKQKREKSLENSKK